ncbi:MAG TPA: hypothetical protein VFP61_14065, partial [Acidimicrobiales bacterium]|nr:hypothetical protein [Acidimicrobiales bacterium]
PAEVLGPLVAGDDSDDDPARPLGIGPMVAVVGELPTGLPVAVVVAVGVVSSLPADRFEWSDGRWHELRLVAADGGDALQPVAVPVARGGRPPAAAGGMAAHRPARGATTPTRIADPGPARDWLARASTAATRGVVVVADTPAAVAALAPPGDVRELALSGVAARFGPLAVRAIAVGRRR